MDTGTAGFETPYTAAVVPRRPVRFRWSVLAFGLALVLALALAADRAAAAVPKYTCDMVLGRACTVTEELAFCMINAFTSYDDCKENGGFLNDLGCYSLYVADYYACYLTTPINVFIK